MQAPGTDAGMVGVLKHGRGRLGGEAYFVPRSGNDQPINGKGLQEDDGYLMTFVIDEESGESELVVYDAKQISDVPVARARVSGRRCPLGFHCTWLSADELAAQKNAPDHS